MRADWFSADRDRTAARRRTVLTTMLVAWLASCSLQDFDRLGPGKSGAAKHAAGEAGESSSGGNAPGAGGTSTDQGGSDAAGGTLDVAGNTGTGNGGTTQTGGSTGDGGKAGRGADSVCPAYANTGGTLVTPPSTGFETAGSWYTLTGRACSVIAAAGSGNACEGKSYLSCEGAFRSDSWDGPLIKLDASFVNGHRYLITVAVRYSPLTAPSTSAVILATVIRGCAGGTTPDYLTLGNVNTTYEWARITGTVDASLPGCTALSAFSFYVQTPSGDATLAKLSLDVDDFRIYDMTPDAGGAGGSGSGGSGVAGSSAGMSGSAGTISAFAGSAGTSKLPSGGTSGAAGSSGAGKPGSAGSN